MAAGGFGSYITAMDQQSYEIIGAGFPGNRAVDVKNPSLGWMIGFLFAVSFFGLFSLVPLRKVCLRVDIQSMHLYVLTWMDYSSASLLFFFSGTFICFTAPLSRFW